jgi:mannose-6-phosphate isomerase-like protein (cupin superfamily)
MVQIFRNTDSPEVSKEGYSTSYVADVEFRQPINTGGFILVTINQGEKSAPHSHSKLEEVFVVLSNVRMSIDSEIYDLESGDVVLVEPNETHSFEASNDSPAYLLAIKFPNLKTDKNKAQE